MFAVISRGETLPECHSEAQPKNLLFVGIKKKQMLRFAQHDIEGVFTL